LVPYLVGGPDERAGIVQLDLGPHLPLPEGPQVRFLTNTGRRINNIDIMKKGFVAEPAPESGIFLTPGSGNRDDNPGRIFQSLV
jgi:hypothetical protein